MRLLASLAVLCSALLPVAECYDEGKRFRWEGANLVWEKASRRLDADTASKRQLWERLRPLDELYMGAKAEGRDGLAAVDKALWRLLRDYGLEDVGDALRLRKDSPGHAVEPQRELEGLADPRLQALWRKARLADGLSTDDLAHVKDELEALQSQVDDYHAGLDGLSHNSVKDSAHLANGSDEEREAAERRLKALNRAIHKALEGLGSRVEAGTKFGGGRVGELWEAALKASLPPAKLAWLEGELRSLAARLEKVEWLKAQVAERNHFDGHDAQHDLRQRLKHQARQADKLENDLRNKLLSVHTEL